MKDIGSRPYVPPTVGRMPGRDEFRPLGYGRKAAWDDEELAVHAYGAAQQDGSLGLTTFGVSIRRSIGRAASFASKAST